MSVREIVADVVGRAKLRHGKLKAVCDDAAEDIAAAFNKIDRKRIARLAREANVDIEDVQAYIVAEVMKRFDEP